MNIYEIIWKIGKFFKRKKDYVPMYTENFLDRAYDLKIKIDNKTIYRAELVNTRVCYDVHLAKSAICFSDRRQPNIHTNFQMIFCKTSGAAKNKIVIGDWTLNLEKYSKDEIVNILRKHIPADNFYSEHDDETIERAFKV